MKKFLTLATIICCASVFTFANGVAEESNSFAPSTESPMYKIACDSAFSPFDIQVEEGEVVDATVVSSANNMGDYYGIDVEIIDAIAKDQGFDYALMPMDFSAVIPGLVSGLIDGAIAGMFATDERRETVDFSDGYYGAVLSLVVDVNDDSIASFDDLKGKIAACKEGTTNMIWCQNHADMYGFTVKVYPDTASMMLAVGNGQADFLLQSYPEISYQMSIGAHTNLKIAMEAVSEPRQLAFSVVKGKNQELLAMFNAGLAHIRANGIYDKIISNYE